MSIDDKGNVTTFVNAPKHPQFARCAQGEFAGQKIPVIALDPGTFGRDGHAVAHAYIRSVSFEEACALA